MKALPYSLSLMLAAHEARAAGLHHFAAALCAELRASAGHTLRPERLGPGHSLPEGNAGRNGRHLDLVNREAARSDAAALTPGWRWHMNR